MNLKPTEISLWSNEQGNGDQERQRHHTSLDEAKEYEEEQDEAMHIASWTRTTTFLIWTPQTSLCWMPPHRGGAPPGPSPGPQDAFSAQWIFPTLLTAAVKLDPTITWLDPQALRHTFHNKWTAHPPPPSQWHQGHQCHSPCRREAGGTSDWQRCWPLWACCYSCGTDSHSMHTWYVGQAHLFSLTVI